MTDIMNKSFQILGIDPNASAERAREAYKDLVQVWHPDRYAHNKRLQLKAQEKIKEINAAYDRVKEYCESRHQEERSRQEQEWAGQETQREAEEEARLRAEQARREAASKNQQAEERETREKQRRTREDTKSQNNKPWWDHGFPEQRSQTNYDKQSRKTSKVFWYAGILILFVWLIVVSYNNNDAKNPSEPAKVPHQTEEHGRRSLLTPAANTSVSPETGGVFSDSPTHAERAAMVSTQASSVDLPMNPLKVFRDKYPQYNDLTDEQLMVALHRKFYSDLPFEEFRARVTKANK